MELPVILRTLVEGSTEDKLKLLLGIHRRLYHKPVKEMRQILTRSGVPIRILALVEDAVALCETCKRWQRAGISPVIRTRLSTKFNQLLLCDLVFFDDAVFWFGVDDAIRYAVIHWVEYKDWSSLEAALRRGWINHYGPPRRIHIDKESALAHDSFGAYCEKLGIVREMVKSDEMHSLMGPLDRRVQLFRDMCPKLLDALAESAIVLEPADKAAEGQIA